MSARSTPVAAAPAEPGVAPPVLEHATNASAPASLAAPAERALVHSAVIMSTKVYPALSLCPARRDDFSRRRSRVRGRWPSAYVGRVCLAWALCSSLASANGRFPAANQLVVDP